jgi:hypothetical protein
LVSNLKINPRKDRIFPARLVQATIGEIKEERKERRKLKEELIK